MLKKLKNNNKIYIKISSLLPSILDRRTASIRPVVFYYWISNNLPHEKTAIQM